MDAGSKIESPVACAPQVCDWSVLINDGIVTSVSDLDLTFSEIVNHHTVYGANVTMMADFVEQCSTGTTHGHKSVVVDTRSETSTVASVLRGHITAPTLTLGCWRGRILLTAAIQCEKCLVQIASRGVLVNKSCFSPAAVIHVLPYQGHDLFPSPMSRRFVNKAALKARILGASRCATRESSTLNHFVGNCNIWAHCDQQDRQ